MDTSVFLAKLIGPYLVLIGIGIFFNQKHYHKVMEQFSREAGDLYLGGVVALFFGLVVVIFHNIWVLDWRIIITLMGWIGLVKGASIIVFPRLILKIADTFKSHTFVIMSYVCSVLVLGGVLVFKGYFG
jgi:hypothetical protein